MRKTVVYYVDKRGKNPVEEFIRALPPDEIDKCLDYIAYLKNLGEEIRRPIGDYLGDKLYELRPKHNRLIYAFAFGDYVVLLHAFRKKTSAIPKEHLTIAKARMTDFLMRSKPDKI